MLLTLILWIIMLHSSLFPFPCDATRLRFCFFSFSPASVAPATISTGPRCGECPTDTGGSSYAYAQRRAPLPMSTQSGQTEAHSRRCGRCRSHPRPRPWLRRGTGRVVSVAFHIFTASTAAAHRRVEQGRCVFWFCGRIVGSGWFGRVGAGAEVSGACPINTIIFEQKITPPWKWGLSTGLGGSSSPLPLGYRCAVWSNRAGCTKSDQGVQLGINKKYLLQTVGWPKNMR